MPTSTHATAPTVHARLLDALFAVSVVALLLLCAELALGEHVLGGERAAIGVVCAVLLVGAWWWRRTARQVVPATVAFTLVAFVASVAGDTVMALLPMFCALLVVVLDVGTKAGAAIVAGLVVTQFVVMTLGGDLAEAFVQSVASGSVLLFILAFAVLLRRSATDSAERAALLADREAAHARLSRANASLRESVEREKELVLARERARSARELHDGLGHRLTVTTMSLDFAVRRRESDPDRAWAEVATARDTVQEALAEMRLWVRALNPVSVEGLTGPAALDAVADAFRGTGVEVTLQVTGTERPMSDAVLLFCHRFVQEGLTNALRHARARHVRLALDYDKDAVALSLTDDGGPLAGDVTPGFGLRSLSDRAAQLGGEVEARSGERGLVLTARVPLHEADATAETVAS
ncbi:MAG: sensor histidine kinase [Mobilicoccus sp.]|nr:sensor histidine kinase [Mobilicoccus sp.]